MSERTTDDPTTTIELIGGDASTPGRPDGDRLLVDTASLTALTGWKVEPSGLCRGDVCVPLRGREELLDGDDVDLRGVSELLGLPLVIDLDEGLGAIGVGAEQRDAELASGEAAQLELADLDGNTVPIFDGPGRKQMLLAFSSWCGCRYDLPAWQQLHDELEPHGFGIVAVAIDEAAEDVTPWVEEVSFPVLLDSDRAFSDRYGVVNVPTVIWVDEQRQIVKPNAQAFGSDDFIEFHGIDSTGHHEALRQWVVNGVAPAVDDVASATTSPEEQLARTEFRLAVELRRRDRLDAAVRHLEHAGELAPDDFTIWRAGLQLAGGDPFGPEFFAQYDAWKARTGGRSYASDDPQFTSS